MDHLNKAMAETAEAVEEMLGDLIPAENVPEKRLLEAMRYSTLGGGKRIRPFLVMRGAALFGVDQGRALRCAAALEMVHCYSLVHDDLPAMDDDDMRRGRPTCHKVYDEATAILAGDALLTQAFQVLADPATHEDPAVRCDLVAALAAAAGPAGMVGGQMIDLLAESTPLEMSGITRLQRMKTGALIHFGCVAGAILGRAHEPARHALTNYAHDLGLAFQIADDLLDVEGSADEMGKAVGKDAAAGKATFVSLMGVERAREQAGYLVDQAIKHLDIFDQNTDLLRDLARFVINRRT